MPGVVTIVGGGASGTLTALHLAREAEAAGRRVHLELCEPRRVGEGLAYSTTDPRHRLNVVAQGMSALPDDPLHFVRWLRRHVAVDYPESGYAPRQHYAEYLEHCLTEVLVGARHVTFTHRAQRVHDVARHGRGLRITLADGSSHPADAVVLATGHGSPSTAWAPAALRRSHRFQADPWRASAAVTVHPGMSIVLVGAGLTMVDMVQRWGRAGVRVHVASRHGLLPLPHAQDPAPPHPVTAIPAGDLSLAQARRIVFDQIRAAGDDWRRGIDGLRPITADIWHRMDDAARAAFLRAASRRWDRVRHRLDPALDAWLAQRCSDGTLTMHTATIESADEVSDSLRVGLSDGTVVDAALVLNCTGTCLPIRHDADPLVLNLLATGLARPGALDLGFATEDGGRLRPSAGATPAPVWAVGPLRRGDLWETTAVPEIRCQAATTARQVLTALPATRQRLYEAVA
ncbi:FAD/NAD(P)-binding protein [uncultured Jatrophihabitans sp.]|uniref:FAD/NAD(P)-binding protein n=1 Tax=uncultured Jatrophihabitans sp. TaxID=1610747 RepID=UPI0035C99965